MGISLSYLSRATEAAAAAEASAASAAASASAAAAAAAEAAQRSRQAQRGRGRAKSEPLRRSGAMEAQAGTGTMESLSDDLLEEVLLRLPSGASLARAALVSRHWHSIASRAGFLARFRAGSPPLLLGIFVPNQGIGSTLPVFNPEPCVHSDRDIGAFMRRVDVLLTRLDNRYGNRLSDCRDGCLLLVNEHPEEPSFLEVYHPFSGRHESKPFPDCCCLSFCLLRRRGSLFDIMSVQYDGPYGAHGQRRIRALESDSGTDQWRPHGWSNFLCIPGQLGSRAMSAPASGLVFWRYGESSAVMLDTDTMEFSIQGLPQLFFPPTKYAIGEMEDGTCCLVGLDGDTVESLYLKVWVLTKGQGGGSNQYHTWQLHKESAMIDLDCYVLACEVHMVAAGQAVLGLSNSRPWLKVDLANFCMAYGASWCGLSGKAYPFQMTPADFMATLRLPSSLTGTPEATREGKVVRCVQEAEDEDAEAMPEEAVEAPLSLKNSLPDQLVGEDQDVNGSLEGLPQQDLCVKCWKDGQLLKCCGCLLSAHDSCFGSSVAFDDSVELYCPICFYNKATQACQNADKIYSEARKSLSAFLGGKQLVRERAANSEDHLNGINANLPHRDEDLGRDLKKQKTDGTTTSVVCSQELVTEKAPIARNSDASPKHSVLQTDATTVVQNSDGVPMIKH